MVGAGREPEARPKVVLDAVRQLAPQHREDVVLLFAQRIVVVNQANPAVKLDAGREIAVQR